MLTYLPHTPGSDHSARSLALKRLWVCCAIRSILTAYSLGINKTHQLLPFFLTPETEIRVEGWRKMAHYHGDYGKVSYPVLREGENRQTYRHLQGMSLPTHEFLFSCHAKGQFTLCWESWWLCSVPLLDCGFRPESFWRASPYKTLKVRSLLWASLTGVLQVLEFVGKGGLVDLFLPRQRIKERYGATDKTHIICGTSKRAEFWALSQNQSP